MVENNKKQAEELLDSLAEMRREREEVERIEMEERREKIKQLQAEFNVKEEHINVFDPTQGSS